MFISIGEEHQVTVSGAVIKHVCCEFCSCEYFFEHTSKAKGSGFSLFSLNNRGAQNRAAEQAKKKLERELKTGVACAPCPECARYQAAMVARMRKSRHAWMNPTGLVILVFTAVLLGIVALANYVPRNRPNADWAGTFLVFGSPGLAGLALVVGRWLLVQWYDPNASGEEKRRELARRKSFRNDGEYVLAKEIDSCEAAEAAERSLRRKPWAKWALGGGIGLLGVVFTAQFAKSNWRNVQLGRASESWPAAKAVIRGSSTQLAGQNDREQFFRPKIEYTYTVDGVPYVGNQLCLYDESGPQYRDFPARMPAGNQIDVRYDPANPAFAVVVAGASSGDEAAILVLVVFSLVFGMGGIAYMVKAERERRRSYRAVCERLSALPPLDVLLRQQERITSAVAKASPPSCRPWVIEESISSAR
jgi:hypothetical protein